MLIEVKLQFDAALRKLLPETTPGREEIVKFLIEHERKQVCLNELCKNILAAEKHLGGAFSPKDYRDLINNAAMLFAQAAIAQRAYYLQSEADRHRVAKAGSEYDEMAAYIKEVGSDVDETQSQGDHDPRPGKHPGSESTGVERLSDPKGHGPVTSGLQKTTATPRHGRILQRNGNPFPG
jgi:hypothetical protein